MAKYTRPRSHEFIEMLAKEYYSSNISIKELSEKYHTDAMYQFRKHGIKLKGRGMQKIISRKGCIAYKWNVANVETEEQAYALGFLMSDGYNTGIQAGLTLKNSDVDILEKIKSCFSNEIKTQRYGNSVSFVISSTLICENLRKFGVIEHKSRNEKHLPNLLPELIRHFIRGYFDGDGTVFVCNSQNNHYLKCNICSSTLSILSEIQCVLKNNNIQGNINTEKRLGKVYHINRSEESIATMDMYRLYIRRKSEIEKFYHYLYDDATIYLQRKYDVFANNEEMFIYKHVNPELTK